MSLDVARDQRTWSSRMGILPMGPVVVITPLKQASSALPTGSNQAQKGSMQHFTEKEEWMRKKQKRDQGLLAQALDHTNYNPCSRSP